MGAGFLLPWDRDPSWLTLLKHASPRTLLYRIWVNLGHLIVKFTMQTVKTSEATQYAMLELRLSAARYSPAPALTHLTPAVPSTPCTMNIHDRQAAAHSGW